LIFENDENWLDVMDDLRRISHKYVGIFFVKISDKELYIVETKGLEDLDDSLEIRRLKNWCEDVNKAQNKVNYEFLFVDQATFQSNEFYTFNDLIPIFVKYK
jgi:type III restriction enzyme